MDISQQKTSTLAMASLITGILGLTWLPVVGSLCAIITGHMARAEIQRHPEALKGDELATVGLILGWIVAIMAAIIFVVLVLVFVGFK
ncbi:DUF4190 domain-containing protein [Xylella fastidiosa]|nr:DUF4190 domain-containing protein [Xylella fastidiosa]ALR03243.1 hypothetical protein OY18_13195 [Xylella fastidiosa]